jgi:hypothetical protein
MARSYTGQGQWHIYTFPPAMGGARSRGLGTASGTTGGTPPREVSCGIGLDICFGELMTGRDGLRFFPLRSEILLRSSMMGDSTAYAVQ